MVERLTRRRILLLHLIGVISFCEFVLFFDVCFRMICYYVSTLVLYSRDVGFDGDGQRKRAEIFFQGDRNVLIVIFLA